MLEDLQPGVLAQRLQKCYRSRGFKLFWAQVQREIERAKVYVIGTPRDSSLAEFNYRRGFLAGIQRMEFVKTELEEALTRGKIPWKDLDPPERPLIEKLPGWDDDDGQQDGDRDSDV